MNVQMTMQNVPYEGTEDQSMKNQCKNIERAFLQRHSTTVNCHYNNKSALSIFSVENYFQKCAGNLTFKCKAR